MDSKEQAIKKAGEKVGELLTAGRDCEALYYPDNKMFVINEYCFDRHEFPYTPPRRIPPKGTMVKDMISGRLGYFSGEHHIDNLWIQIVDKMENSTHSIRTIHWIELQEVEQ
jgi:hypothetical protein